VRCGLARLGTASVTTTETILARGEVAAEAEAVLVARNRDRDGSRPLTEAERAALDRSS